jgi:allantoate deiminase
LPVSQERLETRVSQLAQIGGTADGGVNRQTFTPEYKEAQELVADWMREAGLAVRTDAVGNLIGRREGPDPESPAIMVGSHIDTVLNGGRYDGTVGVLGGIEVAQALKEDGIELNHSLEIAALIEEEGTRWGSGCLGSRAMMGLVSEEVLDRKDRDGITMSEAMESMGVDPDRLHDARRDPRELACYLEMHIEQGGVLDDLGYPVGVVTGIAGPLQMSARLIGKTDHAGATPMNLRKDALVAAAHLVLVAQRSAQEASLTAVGTVGIMEVKPGNFNAIPGEVFMTFDIRDIYIKARDEMEREIVAEVEKVSADNGLRYEIGELVRLEPVVLPRRMVDVVAESCRKVGVPVHELPSGAGHDAQIMATEVDTGMIFLRSKGGISHDPAEFTEMRDIYSGTEVLYHTVLELDK